MAEQDAFAVARRGRRRANTSAARDRRVVLKLSESEDEMLRSLAGAQGVSVQAFVMRAVLTGGPDAAARYERLREELASTRLLLANVANNVNQLAYQANAFARSGNGEPVDEAHVRAVAEDVRSVVQKIDALTGRVEV
ncbi:plasmid mobilization protein [Brachybacterium epidermidis]|uniref:plasmid mobilization protein n=1 Tax=Brachybacterium epidermidis TaxID=2781983 RepID=UPI00398F439E